jgi:RPA family protein
MEGAVRVFAGEFNSSTLTVKKSDPDGIPCVVTPSGTWCRLMYLSGALTEVFENGDMLRCRISDPTGVFEIVIPSVRSELFTIVKKTPVPSFVAITGTAQMYQRKGLYMLSVRPESVQTVDRTVRDIWVLRTADMTLDRLENLTKAMREKPVDPMSRTVMEHYRTTPKTVQELIRMVESALSSVGASVPSVQSLVNPNERILAIIKEHQGISGISAQDVIAHAALQGVSADTATEVIKDLISQDECYQPQKGILKLL